MFVTFLLSTMCPPTGQQTEQRHGDNESNDERMGPFPWSLGAIDAHCHPTDTMSSIASINEMRTRVLTIMSTRSQDQDLVLSVAAQQAVQNQTAFTEHSPEKVVPAFGWHPWFSHQLYDDTGDETTYDPNQDAEEQKTKHYTTVLSHTPDPEFIATLAAPRPLSGFIDETRRRLVSFPTALVGEIGLDRGFRLPQGWGPDEQPQRNEDITPGGREGRLLSPYHVNMTHQVQVFKAQLRLAGDLGRAVSIHGVQAHGVLFDALSSLWKGHEKEVISRRKERLVAVGAEDFSSSDEDDDDGGGASVKELGPFQPKPFPPRVCLHSFSGPPQMLKQYLNPTIPARVFFSFSMVVNLSSPGSETKFADVIRACPDDRLLVESDLHTAGHEADKMLEQIYRQVCKYKGWTLAIGLEKIRKNYVEFIFG